MANLSQMTMDELMTLETERYGRYADQYDHAGMYAGLRADFDEVRNEIEKRRGRELIYVPAARTNLVPGSPDPPPATPPNHREMCGQVQQGQNEDGDNQFRGERRKVF